MTVPPIPVSCADRPTVGGLVIPIVNVRLADGGVDFRSRHQAVYERCWDGRACQVCGKPVGRRAILFGGPQAVALGHYDEAPTCLPCARYVTQACPMLAGRLARFADREALSNGARGHECLDGCGCGGWISTNPDADGEARESREAHAWYAVLIDPAGYVVTADNIPTRCTDGGCTDLHDRVVVNGGKLTAPPLRVSLVSGDGSAWRPLTPAEVAELADEQAGEGRSAS